MFSTEKEHATSGKEQSVGGISRGLWRSLPGTGLYWHNSSKQCLTRHATDKCIYHHIYHHIYGIYIRLPWAHYWNGPCLENNEQHQVPTAAIPDHFSRLFGLFHPFWPTCLTNFLASVSPKNEWVIISKNYAKKHTVFIHYISFLEKNN